MLKNDVTLAVEAIEKSSLVANTTMDAVTANAFMLKHGITIYRWREFITSFNNLKEKQKEEGKFLPRVFAPLDQVLEATTHISRDNYAIKKKHLTKSKEGKNKTKVEQLSHVTSNNILRDVLHNIKMEKDEMSFDNDDDEIVVLFYSDGWFKFNISQNHPRQKISFFIFENGTGGGMSSQKVEWSWKKIY